MLAPWKKSYENLGSILKSRDITLLTKVCIVKAVVFPGIIYGWELDHNEGWTPKKWCFQIVVRIPWIKRRLNQSILKEINPEYSLEGLILKLKLHYFGCLMGRADSKKDPDSGKDWGQEEKGSTENDLVGWYHPLSGHEFEQTPEES